MPKLGIVVFSLSCFMCVLAALPWIAAYSSVEVVSKAHAQDTVEQPVSMSQKHPLARSYRDQLLVSETEAIGIYVHENRWKIIGIHEINRDVRRDLAILNSVGGGFRVVKISSSSADGKVVFTVLYSKQ